MPDDTKDKRDFIVGKSVPLNAADPCLRNGAQFRESLRDGRRIVAEGRDVEDVTTEPTLRRGIDTLAQLFDAQFDPASRDITTVIEPETGQRIATGWLVPYTREDLWRHARMAKFSTYHTFGVFGRPPDYGPVKAIGFLAFHHLIKREDPEAIHKIKHFLRMGQANNLISADIIIDVQTNRKLPMPEQAGRLRIVEERPDGVLVSGAKAGNSVLPQGNIGTISMPPPNPTMPEECAIWSVVPANAPGLTMVLREPMLTGHETAEDHPLGAQGEEADGLLLFDRVFIPRHYIFSHKNMAITKVYTTLGRFAFWKIAFRLSYRAEIFAGCAQMIVNALGTDHVPQVRALVSEVLAYAATLRGMMTASIETAEPTESGVMQPNHTFVTAARLYAIEAYPKIMQILRELSGQGLISRVPRASWERKDIGPLLDAYLPGLDTTSREKNRLFNLVWDISSSAAAMRIALFENINATPAAALREELYRIYDRSEGVAAIKRLAGLD